MYHPVQAMPIVGSRKVERIESAVKAMDVKLEHYEWYEIYAAQRTAADKIMNKMNENREKI